MIGLNKHIVAVVEHDPAWVVLGADACKEVLEAAGSLLRDVQHVGSTSVPGLVAKPIVDIAGGAATFESIPELIGRLTSIDFIYLGDSAENGGHLFVRESSPDVRTLHLHIVKYGDLQWRNYLRFRDFLRTSALACEQYRSLKLELARKFAGDRESYTEAKRALIEQLLRNAPEVGASTHMHLLVDVDGVLQFERSDLEAQVSGALQWSGDPRAFRKILFSDPEFHRALRGECDFLSFLERLLSERQPRLKPGDYLDSWMSDFTLNRGLIDRLAHVQCRSLSLASNQE
ncbi:MAG TPA: GrpB family protein, partial [Steroidobacteraceae bacterium]|nr:GrpB family protein [Steroidobacteraceae bacterium]